MKRIQWSALALALTLPLAACDDSHGAGSPGTLSLNLTDAPGDFAEAWVQIDRIELVGESDESEGGAVVLMDSPVTEELVALANDLELLVNEAVVPAGRYSQLRMVISEACLKVEEEEEAYSVYGSSESFSNENCGAWDGDLQMPSYGTSGLKIGVPGGAMEVDGESRILLLDFDVHESFGRLAGGSGMWVMDPNVRAEDMSFASTLTVTLADGDGSLAGAGGALSEFEAHLDEEVVAFADADEDGTWTATFFPLLPDMYTLSIETAEGVTYEFTLTPSSPQSVTLASGVSETREFVLTEVSTP